MGLQKSFQISVLSTAIATALFLVATSWADKKVQVAGQVSGEVTVSKESKKIEGTGGALYIMAKKNGGQPGPPMAVLRLENPKFPVKFTLSKENAMMPGVQFEGPMTVIARFSPSGNAMDKSGPQGQADQVQVGDSKIKIELNGK